MSCALLWTPQLHRLPRLPAVYLIKNWDLSRPAIHFGGLPRPLQVAPFVVSRYLGATGFLTILPGFFWTPIPRSSGAILYSFILA